MKYLILLSVLLLHSFTAKAQAIQSFLELLPGKSNHVYSFSVQGEAAFFLSEDELAAWQVEGRYWLLLSELPSVRTGIYQMDTALKTEEELMVTFDPETFEEIMEKVRKEYYSLTFIRPWPLEQDAGEVALDFPPQGDLSLEPVVVDGKRLGAVLQEETANVGYYCQPSAERLHYQEARPQHPQQEANRSERGGGLTINYILQDGEYQLDGCWSFVFNGSPSYLRELKYFAAGQRQGLQYSERPDPDAPIEQKLIEQKLRYYEKDELQIDFQLLELKGAELADWEADLAGNWQLYDTDLCVKEAGLEANNDLAQGQLVIWSTEELAAVPLKGNLELKPDGFCTYQPAAGKEQTGRWRLATRGDVFIPETYLLLELGDETIGFKPLWESKSGGHFTFGEVEVPEGLR